MPKYTSECPRCGGAVTLLTSYENHGLPGPYREELVDSFDCENGCDLSVDIDNIIFGEPDDEALDVADRMED